jgi:RNA-directed DNA polymerase
VSERKFLGYRLLSDGAMSIAPKSIERAKQRIRQITRRNRGVSFERVIGELNSFTTGWVTYFRYAKAKNILAEMDGWLRRKLRCVRLKQRKRAARIATFLQQWDVPKHQSWTTGACGKGWWRMAQTPAASQAMSHQWFRECGLVSLLDRYAQLPHSRKPPDTMSTSGGVGRREPRGSLLPDLACV